VKYYSSRKDGQVLPAAMGDRIIWNDGLAFVIGTSPSAMTTRLRRIEAALFAEAGSAEQTRLAAKRRVRRLGRYGARPQPKERLNNCLDWPIMN
jgi:hypothetical protein